ncbi:cholesterol 7-desaturase nvd [Cydia fagiglandana]|uniref:cholesterol 7-desaturase nvd n=1 Tax=Cydia fagiglandana TaxID=1458189 RepID=UPI002FEE2E55
MAKPKGHPATNTTMAWANTMDANCQIENDVLLFYLKMAWALVRSAIELFYTNRFNIMMTVILVLVVYAIYKSYWSPVLYIKELADIGYDHIPKGANREIRIARAMKGRQLGVKLPPPYPNGWFAVAESGNLKNGDVTSIDALGQNLCVYRGEDGVARCVDAYCPHLGANLGIGGKVGGSCIECPFHKWRFNAEGACVNVPGQDSPPKGVSIRTWPTVEADGAVWIWHDADNRPPLWTVCDADELASWGYRGRNEFVVGSHCMDIPENGADVAHLNAVHSPSLLSSLGEKYPFLLNFIGQHSWSAEWSRGEGHEATMKLEHHYKMGDLSLFHMDVVATQMGPGHVRLRIDTGFGPLLISQSVTPMGPLLQRVVHRMFSPAYNAPIVAGFIWGESYMFERDVTIWNNKRYMSSPAYVRTDKTIRAFRAWYAQFYSENSISFKDATQNPLDW